MPCSATVKLCSGCDEPVVALHLLRVGLDQLDRLLNLDDRLHAALAGLQAYHRSELEVLLGDRLGDRCQPGQALAVGRPAPHPAGAAGSFNGQHDRLRLGTVGAAGNTLDPSGIDPLKVLPHAMGTAVDHVRPGSVLGIAGSPQASLELHVGSGVDATARIGQTHGHSQSPWLR